MNAIQYPIKKAFTVLSGLLLTTLLAGCGGSSEPHPNTVASNAPPKAPTGTTTQMSQTTSPSDNQALGDSNGTLTNTENSPVQVTHSIAIIVPLSGPYANIGQSIANAADMAVRDISDRNTGLKITRYDSAKGAAEAATQAITEGNKLILGPLLPSDVRIIGPMAHNANIPVLTFSNDTSLAGNGVYTLGFTPVQAIQRVVTYAIDHKLSRFAGLLPNGTYGRRASATLLRTVANNGGSVSGLANYNRNPQAIGEAVAKLGHDYDAVLIADSVRVAREAAPLVTQTAGTSPQILGTELWATDNNLKTASSLYGAWFASVPDTLFRQLSAKYKSRYGAAPSRLASLGYDAILLAARIAPQWPSEGNFPEKMLLSPTGFNGIDGIFRFKANGIADRGLAVQKISEEGLSVIDPAPSSFEK
ncbi:MAG: penicillin-binding protein activator [Zymomonas mobilis subsp. pomaceae]|uniref:Extracellular ligand-binding receptor n=1 Tax=Zymomonas mobilis subsp. pomaceae (strain ATCC 29192 / DSM 22645 / JCM 10191 / CCUG 17912 / NBRC 13757 / NCIMB 11200 / NRRL B-4491 / Barker I) TaxID=579138 RepID=F8EV25_ZYMMT|nr:penicillin-binding protein activator [Zymomonas mobilis]AEI38243.1 Extracellular ligand-binding receptor [Zymomonas mobilis subsp. pomaceae ATCC 29192]MDX5947932.1 penicillin-binding protein activator [Zymomonas mobilis subsp. pomaceae]GEB89261.1 penicillin-binding protein activator [Zymomonas mobilis subsp. pomaceae]